MGWTVTRDFFLNLGAAIVGDPREPTGMIGCIIAIGVIFVGVRNWHRKRVTEEKRGVDSWYVIALFLLVAIIAIGGASYGLGLRSATQQRTVEKPGSPSTPTVETKSVLFPARFYSKADKERIADALTAIQGSYREAGVTAIRETREGSDHAGQATEIELDRLVQIMNGVKSRVEGMDAAIEKVRRDYSDYHDEIGMLLNSQHLLRQFGVAADNFSNMLVVWKNVRPNAGEHSNQLARVLMAQRESLYRSMNDFDGWMRECNQTIEATRTALRA